MDILSGISNTLTIVGRLKEISDKVADAEMAALIASLQEDLVNVRMEAIGVKEDNVNLRQRLMELEQKEKINLKFRDNVYFREGDTNPICPPCYDDRGKVIHMMFGEANYGSEAFHMCPICKHCT